MLNFTKYVWVKTLRSKTVLHGFIKIVSKYDLNQISYGLLKADYCIIINFKVLGT